MKDVDGPEANSTVPSHILSKSVLGNTKPTFLADAGAAHSAHSTSGPHTASQALMPTSAYASASVDVQVAAASALANIHLEATASALSTPGRSGMASSDVHLNVEALSAGPRTVLSHILSKSVLGSTKPTFLADASSDVRLNVEALSAGQSTVLSHVLSKSVLGNTKPTFVADAGTSGPHTKTGSGLSSKVAASPAGHSGSTDLLSKAGGPSSPALMPTSAYASASVDVQVAAASALANIHLEATASALSTPGRKGMASSDVHLNVQALSAGQSGAPDLLPASRGSSPPVGKSIPAHAGANIHLQLAASTLSAPGTIGSEHGF